MSHSIFFRGTYKGYIYNPENQCDDALGNDCHLPLDVDTEYQSHLLYKNPSDTSICTNITVQVKSVMEDTGMIFAHPDIVDIARHPVYKYPIVALDYLEAKGYQVRMARIGYRDTILPTLQIDFYGFYFLAELMRIVQDDTFQEGNMFQDIGKLCAPSTKQYGHIKQERRVRTYTGSGYRLKNYVELPWSVEVNGFKYRLRMAIYDTGAIHGVASYADFCNNTGVSIPDKDTFTSQQKGEMLKMYTEHPDDFDNYALGDLYNYQALMGNIDMSQDIYRILGLEDYFTPPRLTIGATTSKIFESAINKVCGAIPGDKSYINALVKHASADTLKRNTISTSAYLIKVDGGRCRNNRPTDTVDSGVLADIDIQGCYGNGLKNQVYPLGTPITIGYPLGSKHNDYDTLASFRKKYESLLVPGLWIARVSTREGYRLKCKQDILASWLPPKDLSQLPTDTEMESTDIWWDIDNVGVVKIFNNEVVHAIITHDFLQWLDNVASRNQRREMMDNLVVEATMFYPKQLECTSVTDLITRNYTHKGKNQSSLEVTNNRVKTVLDEIDTYTGLPYQLKSSAMQLVSVNYKKQNTEEECYYWYGINLSDLLLSSLLMERGKHAKKTPMNNLMKLIINTIYGIMVSPFFAVGNVVVGNNITARARTLAWYMEKGLHIHQSITDGGVFNLNQVVYPKEAKKRISGEYSVNLYLKTNLDHHTLKPLDSIKDIQLSTYDTSEISVKICKDTDETTLSLADAKDWIALKAWEHLQQLFPNVDILHQDGKGQFNFEVKDIHSHGTFHGTANYSLSLQDKTEYKMRSYSKREHILLSGNADDIQVVSTTEKPSERFLSELNTPKKVVRATPFLKENILKISDYQHHENKWSETDVYPGCTIEVASLLKEFSFSQFTYQTLEQYRTWEHEYKTFVKKYGQSYEQFYLNEDGTLNFQAMVEDIDSKIQAGKLGWFDGISKRKTNAYRMYMEHPSYQALLALKSKIEYRYKTIGDDTVDSDDSVEYEPDKE
jgi:hypothetical protein